MKTGASAGAVLFRRLAGEDDRVLAWLELEQDPVWARLGAAERLRYIDHSLTAGCLFINSNVVMSSCQFTSFKAGAIFSVSHSDGEVIVTDCDINKCSTVGVYC